jgi:hypothetical protein
LRESSGLRRCVATSAQEVDVPNQSTIEASQSSARRFWNILPALYAVYDSRVVFTHRRQERDLEVMGPGFWVDVVHQMVRSLETLSLTVLFHIISHSNSAHLSRSPQVCP